MNLSDMVAQICADTGYVDADDQVFARTALRQRDDLLWRMGLWKDSLVQANLPVDPVTNLDHAEGVIYLPEVIERVIGVRTADANLRVSGLETFYRVDFDKFSQTGSPMEFAKLGPGWFTYRASPSGHSATGFNSLVLAALDSQDDGAKVRLTWSESDGTRHVVTKTVDISGASIVCESTGGIIVVESLFKPVTSDALNFFPQDLDPLSDAVASMAAGDTRSPANQRIRVFPIPTAAGALKILGKAGYVPLDFDAMEPRITGSHLVLMAFAKHLLLKRGGENGAALDAVQEGQAMLDVLKKEEMLQEANNQRIIPDSGYGDIYFGPGREGAWIG